uniref:Uncharacterized protein n=1 Tax=Panagrolaimus sp. JU765 TaxID=591449 RepID=A0AC34Q4W8_9BILA
MKMLNVNSFIILALVLACFVLTESAVARMKVNLGEEARFDFGENMLVIKRTTRAHKDSQYIFAAPHQDGSWTTDGENKIGSHSQLYWNGTLVIKKVTLDDVGNYEMPMETPRPNLARTMVDFVLEEE